MGGKEKKGGSLQRKKERRKSRGGDLERGEREIFLLRLPVFLDWHGWTRLLVSIALFWLPFIFTYSLVANG